MKKILALFILLLSPLTALTVEGAQPSSKSASKQPAWSQLTPEQQKILAPIAEDWDQIPDEQRRRILATAKRYPKMTSVQKERFTKRLPEWKDLTVEQRDLARERYKEFQRLPPAQKAQQPKPEVQPVEQVQPPAIDPAANPASG